MLRARMRIAGALGLLGLSALMLLSCGYRVAAHNRLPRFAGSLAVTPLLNETTTYEVEQVLTRALVAEFVKRSGFSVVNDPQQSDAVLSGKVNEVTVSPVTYGKTAFASTFLVSIYVAIEVQDRRTGKILFQKPNYLFREEYVINLDPEEFFSEANPAMDRIAEDFAASVVTTIVEGF